MSSRMRIAILGLSLSLGTLLYAAMPSAAADGVLKCTDLLGCGGAAACATGGNANGCEITCTGGGTAECVPIESD